VVVVGGGQAGLSMSWWLCREGVDHVVLEAARAGHEWRDRRWDSFCLVTPNWQCALPGFPYDGPDPDGFMLREQVCDYLDRFVASFAPPLHEGVRAVRLRGLPDGTFEVTTSAGTLTADQVVVATGPYHVPRVPRLAERLPAHVAQLHSADYRNPAQLPEGAVLVVGTGQSGCQIAEDLHLTGRRVHLATGRAPRVARTYRGRDCVAWLSDMGTYTRGVDQFDDVEAVRFRTNHYVTGRDGGRDIDLRRFALEGMRLYGLMEDYQDGNLRFRDTLKRSLDQADRTYNGINAAIDKYIAEKGIAAPAQDHYAPVWEPDEPALGLTLDGSGITSLVWCIGFLPDFRWLDASVFNGAGSPKHKRGVTNEDGVYFIGLPWLNTWGSGRFGAVGRDAEHIVQIIQKRLGAERFALKFAV
jgi:putative flavoprotein involved in K+ transport